MIFTLKNFPCNCKTELDVLVDAAGTQDDFDVMVLNTVLHLENGSSRTIFGWHCQACGENLYSLPSLYLHAFERHQNICDEENRARDEPDFF